MRVTVRVTRSITFYLMIPFYIVVDYGIRCIWTYRIRRKGVRENARTIIIVAPVKSILVNEGAV